MSVQQFHFDSTKRRLLHSVLNEVLNGFAIQDFDEAIGTDKAELRSLLDNLDSLPESFGVELDRSQTVAFYNSLRESLRELGEEEFHTRTGFRFEDGNTTLRELGALIARDSL